MTIVYGRFHPVFQFIQYEIVFKLVIYYENYFARYDPS